MHEILARLQREIAEGVRGLSAEETQARRGPGKWSIQQIVEHLALSYESTVSTVEARVVKGTRTKAQPTLAQRVGQMAVMRFGYFPSGRTAPPGVCPAEPAGGGLSAAALEARVAECLIPMDVVLMRAEEMFGPTRRSISHLVLGPLSVMQWRRFHLLHGEHHLKQIRQTREGMRV